MSLPLSQREAAKLRKNLIGGLPFPTPEGRKRPARPLQVRKPVLSPAQSREEDDHLISLFIWIKQWRERYPVLARTFHTENEGALVGERRSYTRKSDGKTYEYSPAGMKRRSKGVRAGVPDMLNLTPRRGFPYFAAELKVRDGEPSPAQAAELAWMKAEGAFVHLCWCWSEVAHLMLWYFEIADRDLWRAAGKASDYIVPAYGGHDERCGCGLILKSLYGKL